MSFEPWKSELRGLHLDTLAETFRAGIGADDKAVWTRRVHLIENEMRRRQGCAVVEVES